MPEQIHELLRHVGLPGAEVVPENGNQPLRAPEDWWTIVLGSGLRATVDAMDAPTAQRIHDQTVNFVRDHAVQAIQTNVIYTTIVKDSA
jgi:hypothetical protein